MTRRATGIRSALVCRLTAAVLACTLAAQPLSAADQFMKVSLIVNTGEKGEEQEVVLRFEERAMLIVSRGGTNLKNFAYEAIEGAEYSYSKSPRWKSGIGAAIAVGVFALPIFFMKGKKHWLTVKAGNDFALMRLDKNNYKLILPTFEARTGKKVELVADEK